MLTDGDTEGFWLTAQPNPKSFIKCLASQAFIILATHPLLIADPGEMTISSKLKLNLFWDDRDSWVSHFSPSSQILWEGTDYLGGWPESHQQEKMYSGSAPEGHNFASQALSKQLPALREPFRGEKKYSPRSTSGQGRALYQVKTRPELSFSLKLSLSLFGLIFGSLTEESTCLKTGNYPGDWWLANTIRAR